MASLELSDIQSCLFKEYKEMGCSRYYLVQVKDATLTKKFLASVADSVTHANATNNETSLNIGFTSQGLIALGYNNEENMRSFSREFREGMVTPHRQRLLGDFDSSDPSKWQWGGPNNERVDLILMVFGKNEVIAENYFQSLKQQFESGLSVVHILNGKPLPNDREHFGFRDGISQPVIKESKVAAAGNNDDIEPGEFVMGYKNEYDIYPDAPLLKVAQGNLELLADNPGGYENETIGKPFKDLGRNGTYFVLRQLKQDVDGYWKFLKKQTVDEKGNINNKEATKIAAKLMGRWPSGAPLIKHPDADPGIESNDNSFSYIKEDKDGEKCPFGSHIRRMNPRDHFEESTPGVSLKLTRRHRIMRRVRSYGEDFIGSAENHKPDGEVGLLFGCFNANISKQFEFIQYTWANSPKFKRLYDDPDPIIGVRECPATGVKQNFTIPQKTVNKVIPDLQSFVTVKGGAYFFFPSVTVIKFLGTI
jgi:deferrochelatase/peroxidase EfeB